VAQRGSRPTRDERRSGSGSLTHADELRMATPATSSTLVERATQKHGRAAGYHPRRGGRYANAGTPGNRCVQPGDPHGKLPSALPLADLDRQVHRGRRTPVFGSTFTA
jgi:hypothetical protein